MRGDAVRVMTCGQREILSLNSAASVESRIFGGNKASNGHYSQASVIENYKCVGAFLILAAMRLDASASFWRKSNDKVSGIALAMT